MGTPITVVNTTFVPVPMCFFFPFDTVFVTVDADFADAVPETGVTGVDGLFIYENVHNCIPFHRYTLDSIITRITSLDTPFTTLSPPFPFAWFDSSRLIARRTSFMSLAFYMITSVSLAITRLLRTLDNISQKRMGNRLFHLSIQHIRGIV